MDNCPNCGRIRGNHSSILQGCMCQWQMQSTQEKSKIETVPAQGTLLPKRKRKQLTDEEINELVCRDLFGGMSQQLLRRAWDVLDSFKQAYPENWHEDDQKFLDDLLKADLYLSGVKRKWVGLTDEEIDTLNIVGHESLREFVRSIEAKLKEKNG